MQYDELAFVNQQLAGMLKAGVPLEGALRQVCATMNGGPLRHELEKLEADLAQGIPFEKAISARQLPELYTAMLRVGVRSNNFPSTLTLVADYYQRLNFLWSRLKGLMIYPATVLFAALAVAIFLATVYGSLARDVLAVGGAHEEDFVAFDVVPEAAWMVGLLLPVIVLGVLAMAFVLTVLSRQARQFVFWRFPGFRDAHLSRFASSMAMMLRGGCDMNESLALFRNLERNSALDMDLSRWESRLAAGQSNFSEVAEGSKLLPPLFVWLVAGEREDWGSGFQRAAEIYQSRAMHRIDMLLNAALPVSILFLGLIIVAQLYSLLRLLLGGSALLDMGFL